MGELTPICQNGSIRYLDAQLRGAPTVVLFFLLLNGPLSFSEEDLGFYTGYSRPTLHGALNSLARYKLVQQLGERPVWSLTAHILQLDLVGDLVDADAAKKIFFPSSSSSTLLDQKLLLTTTAASKKNFSQGVLERLRGAGVFAGPAERLAADPWVTEERIDAWMQQLRGDPAVRSLGAVLYSNLQAHLEAGGIVEKRAEVKVCPVCWTHPCMCEEEEGRGSCSNS